jgi:site-specific DNA-adenine methylase
MRNEILKAPFPYFGGKSRAAELIWSRFGKVVNYVEPFAGSLAVLLGRPQPFTGAETVNDKDGLISNFWRALSRDPEAVAYHGDWPVSECDLHARHLWLVENRESLTSRLEGDPEYFDAKLAGWWVWGISCWIGSGWCKGDGPWRAEVDEDGHRRLALASAPGIERVRPALSSDQGVIRRRISLGSGGRGVHRKIAQVGDLGRGINRQLVHLGDSGQGLNRLNDLIEYFNLLADRLRRVRVCCGDWSRVLGPSVTTKHGLTAVLLDPPYSGDERQEDLYAKDDNNISAKVREWAIENGGNRLLRIALCGYEGEHDMPADWECVKWRPRGGYDGQNKDKDNQNRDRERIWFSPHCAKPAPSLFDEVAE